MEGADSIIMTTAVVAEKRIKSIEKFALGSETGDELFKELSRRLGEVIIEEGTMSSLKETEVVSHIPDSDDNSSTFSQTHPDNMSKPAAGTPNKRINFFFIPSKLILQ